MRDMGRIGTVIEPEVDVTELGGPSGHETCRWTMETFGVLFSCSRTAGHHRTLHTPDHWDASEDLFWDGTGRMWLP